MLITIVFQIFVGTFPIFYLASEKQKYLNMAYIVIFYWLAFPTISYSVSMYVNESFHQFGMLMYYLVYVIATEMLFMITDCVPPFLVTTTSSWSMVKYVLS
jgi:hypothetical protein